MSKSISPWESFLYYGKDTLENESIYDLNELLTQPKRSLYYYRRGSAGLNLYENNPNGIFLSVLIKFEIANAIAYRNSIVVDGQDGYRDRRIAVSQNSITVTPEENNLDVRILYFLFDDYEKPTSNSFKLLA